MSRLLLISPEFHGYWSSIADAFSSLGHEVGSWRYDSRGWTDKGIDKIRYDLPSRLGADAQARWRSRLTRRAVALVKDTRPDAVVVIKGDVLGADFWSSVRRIPHVTWLYDELRRTRYVDDTVIDVGPIASYSARDVAHLRERGVQSAHVPLAFDPAYADVASIVSDAAVFVGARYPVRAQMLEQIHALGAPVLAYGRDWSRHPLDRLRSLSWQRPQISGARGVPRELAYALMRGAPAAINLHGDQDGLTMRTFEAAGAGAVQLIDRPDVAASYEPGTEVIVCRGAEEFTEQIARARRDRAWSRAIRAAAQRRTLAEHTFRHRALALSELL